jgi:epoxide hydrolase-like predicted phosphatase
VGGWFDSNRAHFFYLNFLSPLIAPEVKTLIFDLGGVILDLSVDHTLEAFAQLSRFEKEKVIAIYQSEPTFELYEKGLVGDDDFRSFIRKVYNAQATDEEIDRCWNAMLRGIPAVKLQLLTRLMKSYQVILLSNTNNIHLAYINNRILPGFGVTSLDPFFHHTYYSHLMKMRKPDAEIFEKILTNHNLNPAETLFLDDNKLNVEGANTVGIKTVHVYKPEMILEYFHE